MSDNGMDFGGHTRNNTYLPSITDAGILEEEIFGSDHVVPREDHRLFDLVFQLTYVPRPLVGHHLLDRGG